jgi:hypothetical protein
MMPPRAQLVGAALGFLRLEAQPEARPPALLALHRWVDTWTGIGLIERGMARQGYDLSLTRHANEGWRATFYITEREHSATGATGSAWKLTPWRAVQGAAWETLNRMESAA